MTTVTPDLQAITDSVLALLRTELGASTAGGLAGRAGAAIVGDGQPPPNAPGTMPPSPQLPYVILYPLDGGQTFSTQAQATDFASLTYQATSVGGGRQQAQWMATVVAEVLFAMTPGQGMARPAPPAAGWTLGMRVPDGPRPGATVGGTLWSVPERFRVYVSKG